MGYSPSPIRRDSVISQAAQEICRYIEAERLSPGEALPPETRLSQMLGISRNSLREALRVLHGLGHVEKTAGRRVVVTAAGQGGKSVFDQSVLVEAAPVANEVRSTLRKNAPSFPRSALPIPSWASLMQGWPSWKRRSPGRTSTRPRPRTTRSTPSCSQAPEIRCSWPCSTRRRWQGFPM